MSLHNTPQKLIAHPAREGLNSGSTFFEGTPQQSISHPANGAFQHGSKSFHNAPQQRSSRSANGVLGASHNGNPSNDHTTMASRFPSGSSFARELQEINYQRSDDVAGSSPNIQLPINYYQPVDGIFNEGPNNQPSVSYGAANGGFGDNPVGQQHYHPVNRDFGESTNNRQVDNDNVMPNADQADDNDTPANTNPANTIYSDGDPNNRAPTDSNFVAATPEQRRQFINTLRNMWHFDGGDRQQEIDLPAGYTLMFKAHPGAHRGRYIYGHPGHRRFRTLPEFYPHFKYLVGVTNGTVAKGQCLCSLCGKERE